MARSIWKGSISFGLINIPVSLYAAEVRSDIQFHMVDSRNHARVRYERVNASTGEEVPWNQVVKGYEYDDGKYALLSSEEMEKVSPEATKTIDIEDFIDIEEIDYLYFDKPYYLEANKTGEKSYILLAKALEESGKAGIARVVIRSRQHLCAILSREGHLLIALLRFPQEIRDLSEFKVPDASASRNKLKSREVDMAVQLIESMTVEWDPDRYHDEYREKLMEWIEKKIEEGQIEAAPEDLEDDEKDTGDKKVVDLMDYLKKSVEAQKGGGKGKRQSSGKRKTSKRKTNKKASKKSARKSSAKKTKRKSSRKAS